MKIESTEIEIRGNWIFDGSTMKTDKTTKRIEELIKTYLIEVSIAVNGWEKLFKDPNDKRYWELTYPESEMQGGGPPLLRNLSEFEVKQKYRDVVF
jgi:hypothetical protein